MLFIVHFQLVTQCSAEELAEVVFPCLLPSLTLWQYLSLRADAVSRSVGNEVDDALSDSGFTDAADKSLSNVDLAVMLDEYAAMHREVQNMCNEKLDVGLLEKPADDASGCENDPVKSEPSGLVNSILDTDSTLTSMNNNSANNETSEQHVTNDLDVNRTDNFTCQEKNSAQVNCVDTAVIATSDASTANVVEKLSLDAASSDDFTSTAELKSVSAESLINATVVDSSSACDQLLVSEMCGSNSQEAPASVDIEDGLSSSHTETTRRTLG